jgi:hypothetical protein
MIGLPTSSRHPIGEPLSRAIDPQSDVPTGMNPMAQCAFEILALNVSAIRAI